MGITPSVCLSIPNISNHFGIIFGHTDRLRLILPTAEILDATKSVISSYWNIQSIEKSQGFVELKINGTPWQPSKSTDISVKHFMCALLKEYYELGWHMKISIELQHPGNDSSELIFEKAEKVATNVACLSLNDSDKIRVISLDEKSDIASCIKQVILKHWPYGIYNEAVFDKGVEFHLHGKPWSEGSNDGVESYYSVLVINEIMSVLYRRGWVFVSAIKTGKRQIDINSLYFKRDTKALVNESIHLFAVSLNKNDRIRFIKAPPSLIMPIRTNMGNLWKKGVQGELEINGAYEFKLKGSPWWCENEDIIEAKKFIGELMGFLHENNAILYAVCDLTWHLSKKSTFFFKWNPVWKIDKIQTLCVSINEKEKLRIIGGNENFIQSVRQSIFEGWPDAVKYENDFYDSWQFKLNGHPFTSTSSNNIYVLVTMIHILRKLQAQGLIFKASADISGIYYTDDDDSSKSYSLDMHTWYFVGNYVVKKL